MKVFVHGNPETDDIWSLLLNELSARGVTDTVCLTPPGFGSPTPPGWSATREEYAAWLTAELGAIAAESGDVDVVAHDWGAGHLFGVLADNPGLVRSWASDCLGLLHRDYVWHDAAQQWQTPEVGEAAVGALVGLDAETFAAVFGALGMTDTVARRVSARLDEETGRCILGLYRSGAQPAMRQLGERFIAAAPPKGLVMVAENDHFAGPHESHHEMARAVGAHTVELAGVGHWWMLESASAAADVLVEHWSHVV